MNDISRLEVCVRRPVNQIIFEILFLARRVQRQRVQ